MKKKPDWFLPGMAVAVGLAWAAPAPGAHGGWLHPELLTKAGIALIFFLHGVALSFSALRAGTLRWRLHLVVQLTTFLLFPLLGLGLLRLAGGYLDPNLQLGVFYLCALPSTVSSSVALTATARGNVPAAVFNATLSSLLGVLLTPLWIGVWLKTGGQPLPLGQVMLDLTCWLVLPLGVGQLMRPWLGSWAERNHAAINVADRGTVLVLVYTSFCDSMRMGVWTGQGAGTVLFTLGACGLMLAAALAGVGAWCRAWGFPAGDRIAAVFCGSKKTLASGVPMAQLIFGAHPGLGLILLPIMIYHPLQLIVCGVLAGRWARRPAVGPAAKVGIA